MTRASSTGVAVTSQTRCPASQVALRERPGAAPDAVGHDLVVDLLAEPDHVVDLRARHERERCLAGHRDVLGVLVAAQPEHRLADGELEQVGGGEQARVARPLAKW